MHELHLPGSGLTTVAGRWFDWKIFLFLEIQVTLPATRMKSSHQWNQGRDPGSWLVGLFFFWASYRNTMQLYRDDFIS